MFYVLYLIVPGPARVFFPRRAASASFEWLSGCVHAWRFSLSGWVAVWGHSLRCTLSQATPPHTATQPLDADAPLSRAILHAGSLIPTLFIVFLH